MRFITTALITDDLFIWGSGDWKTKEFLIGLDYRF